MLSLGITTLPTHKLVRITYVFCVTSTTSVEMWGNKRSSHYIFTKQTNVALSFILNWVCIYLKIELDMFTFTRNIIVVCVGACEVHTLLSSLYFASEYLKILIKHFWRVCCCWIYALRLPLLVRFHLSEMTISHMKSLIIKWKQKKKNIDDSHFQNEAQIHSHIRTGQSIKVNVTDNTNDANRSQKKTIEQCSPFHLLFFI